DETNTTSVPVLMEEDDDDPENWITKKTLLEEIKANFSSDESEESDDTKNITEKKDETNTRSEGICEKSNLKSDSDSEEIKKLKYRSPLVTYNLNISGGESAEETKESNHRKRRKVSMDDSGLKVTENITEHEDDEQSKTRSLQPDILGWSLGNDCLQSPG
uniref:DNA helicase n=1 Tax=Phascolarctos cinereus TaxID=38626 RepID=A0A6P5JWG3_PHACI